MYCSTARPLFGRHRCHILQVERYFFFFALYSCSIGYLRVLPPDTGELVRLIGDVAASLLSHLRCAGRVLVTLPPCFIRVFDSLRLELKVAAAATACLRRAIVS